MTEFIKRLNDRLNYNSQNIKISKYEYIYISILCLYLVYVAIVSLGWISNPWNNEYREYANTEIVRFIIEGKDVFGGEVDGEPYAYLYGPLFAYLTGGFYRLFNLTSDVSVFLRTISGICTVLCGLIGYYEVKRQTKNLFLSLLAFCLILISGWSYSPVSGMPNSFGVLLFLLSLFFGSRDNRAMIILSAIFAALTIYTKQYFACAIVPVAVYLLFKSIKKFYLFAGAFILFFLLSFLVTLNYIPLFWEITFSHHVAAASVNIRHSLWQWGTFILFYFPLVILFILAIVMFIKDRMSCNREMSLTDRLKPLFSLRKNISIYLISAVIMFGVVMVLSLHQGTRMTYFYQLLLPSLAIFSVPYFYIIKNRFLRILMFGCIVIFSLLHIDNRYGFTQYLSGEKLEAWIDAESFLKSNMEEEILVLSPLMSAPLERLGIKVYNSGQKEFYPTLSYRGLFADAVNIAEHYDLERDSVIFSIVNKHYKYIIADQHIGNMIPVEVITDNYRLSQEFELSNATQEISLFIYER